MKNYVKIGKTISYLLRHKPDGLSMDKQGYVLVDDLLKKVNISQSDLDFIVLNNDKSRFSYLDENKKYIRASQGHSIAVKIDFKQERPPRELYHGTSEEKLVFIMKTGLSKMKRNHVHLTDDKNVAYLVGKRYSKRKEPIILIIDSAKMFADGYKFFLSDNKIWLTDNVPPNYIKNEG